MSAKIIQFPGVKSDEGGDDKSLAPRRPSDFDKYRVFEAYVSEGMTSVLLFTDVRGVDIPDFYRRHDNLKLNFSYRFGTDLTFDDYGITQNLHFRDVGWYECFIPWSAIRLIARGPEHASWLEEGRP